MTNDEASHMDTKDVRVAPGFPREATDSKLQDYASASLSKQPDFQPSRKNRQKSH